jgi:hypothetical protein
MKTQILALKALANISPRLATLNLAHVDVNFLGGPASLSEVQAALNDAEARARVLSVRGEDGQLRYRITSAGLAFLAEYGGG